MATLEEMQARLAEYRAAESRILRSQEYTVGQGMNSRRSRRADLEVVQAQIRELEAQISAATPGARSAYRIVPGGC